MKKIKKVLILGSGALKIGQAGEFDYSGSQAIKALKEEGIKSVVINPNIATVQTSQFLADRVYFHPVTPYFVEKIILKEKPDGIFLSFGGQTALNCGVELYKSGVLKKNNVRVLGSPIESIILTEDRDEFAKHLKKIRQMTPISFAVTTEKSALDAAEKIGYPVMMRSAFALGGQGSGVVRNKEEMTLHAKEAFAFSPQILVEQYLHHYKEVEYEVVRDRDDNCVTVCNMENFDPLGIHTGESIVVAPSQTLTNFEYHTLRRASIDIVRSLGIIGECNIQFALNPNPKNKLNSEDTAPIEYAVIEVNARLSRSSALASKATGYPLAYVAAKLALGKRLWEIKNQVTQVTQSFFEPALDYVVVKFPRWDIEKFKGADERIGSSMKSVGEVMGIGRTFPEALQKAVRMLEIGVTSASSTKLLEDDKNDTDLNKIIADHIRRPTPKRLFAICYALYRNISIEELHKMTGITKWFLQELQKIVDVYKHLHNQKGSLTSLTTEDLIWFKRMGVTDSEIAKQFKTKEITVRAYRKKKNVTPAIFQIDTLAAEFPAKTNYLYTTYHGSHHDVKPLHKKGVIILGSGPYRIGSSVEFDWSCVSTAMRLSKYKKASIIINCNPETVSTDYDMSARLYFEELNLERVMDIYEFEKSFGLVVSVGGQTPNNLAHELHKYKLPLLGTSAVNIDRAEDRNIFSEVLDKLGIRQPRWVSATTEKQAIDFSKTVGFPVLVRPSYVLSGSAMNICETSEELSAFLQKASKVNTNHPVTVSKFWENASEIELDAVAQNGQIVLYALSEHLEQAGVHSGDATIIFPAQRVYLATAQKIIDAAKKLAKEYAITGPFNIQFLAREDTTVSVIEMNLRASRTFPLISKGSGYNFAFTVVDSFFGKAIKHKYEYPSYSVIKAPQFSFSRLTGADPILRVEMASTGEVGCFGPDVKAAFLTSMLAVGHVIPKKAVLLSVGNAYKEDFASYMQILHNLGYTLYTTEGTSSFLKHRLNIQTKSVPKGYQGGAQTVVDLIQNGIVDCVINIRDKKALKNGERIYKKEITDGFKIRRASADHNIPLITNIHAAKLFVSSLKYNNLNKLPIEPWDHYVPVVKN
ncbi:carbamoyl phosphate synthase large subunit [Candidatus Roizmanbacteria bacterium RIFCSPLOWO2_01_FULL_38_12]|uniref:Carbamoyl phosphate synthase arginine-specific large chain n=1 Tax=Candidatus Roizmanbacteria bacterium RIFCSPLOWO2_01_FULL_38_12 TaxID=1802061 RepID=A0A1F7IYX7_9BACT|nr:MAG: carbamoyl phosphate synthase large subunit [Candidatus Roizmanbacteria bacterium RIFCSPHIGHO2_01_FULL_38_15]OGK34408.1 MAG: carbamoyl phosphate synthase large subunit [Candidatus Roizmanbacteria bacterium RIFCSPHIGHO2_12_FULL_38_13]OGK48541.1 MAG: carbamoyl phosphate synthase large subunit [Candidatus Roizmanbacteria bacterium RIFCSPLOWO2_01_FULL_38_12]